MPAPATLPQSVLSVAFHLTHQCNLRCAYCYTGAKVQAPMSRDVADAGIDLTLREARSTAVSHLDITFIGGEPLLEKDLLLHIADRFQREAAGLELSFRLSTNGTLLTEALLRTLLDRRIYVSLSLDGPPEIMDAQRPDAGGRGISGRLEKLIPTLLRHNPLTNVTCVVTPAYADRVAGSVQWIHEKGFRFITVTLDYSAPWTEADMRRLEKSYRRLSAWYWEKMQDEARFYLSCFDERIRTRTLAPLQPAERCGIARRQFSIAPDGELYPCVQFVTTEKVPAFLIGHVGAGLDRDCAGHLHACSEAPKPECAGCALHDRCSTWCACINFASTGSITAASPVACHHEQILMPIVDDLANRLWKSGNRWFLHKHYNPAYSLFSQLEISLGEI